LAKEKSAECSDETSASYRRQIKVAVIFYAVIEAIALAIFIYKFSR
jgi:hypothetical protein